MGADSAKWMTAISECLAAAEREQAGSHCPVVDHEVLSSDQAPDDLCIWLICRSKDEKQQFRDTEHARFVSEVKKRMLAAGFPESAVASLTTEVTSRDEVEGKGGRISFLR